MTHLVPLVLNILYLKEKRKEKKKFPVELTLQEKAIQTYFENMIQCTIQSAVPRRKYFFFH